MYILQEWHASRVYKQISYKTIECTDTCFLSKETCEYVFGEYETSQSVNTYILNTLHINCDYKARIYFTVVQIDERGYNNCSFNYLLSD